MILGKAYFDEFSRLTIDKMAQKMEDLTYLYEETKVPKKHYKKQLEQPIEELIESSVEVNLIDVYVKTLSALKKENEKLFFKALLAIEKKVTVSTIKPQQYQALEYSWLESSEKKRPLLNADTLETYDLIMKNGVTYMLNNERNEHND